MFYCISFSIGTLINGSGKLRRLKNFRNSNKHGISASIFGYSVFPDGRKNYINATEYRCIHIEAYSFYLFSNFLLWLPVFTILYVNTKRMHMQHLTNIFTKCDRINAQWNVWMFGEWRVVYIFMWSFSSHMWLNINLWVIRKAGEMGTREQKKKRNMLSYNKSCSVSHNFHTSHRLNETILNSNAPNPMSDRCVFWSLTNGFPVASWSSKRKN